MKLWRSKPDREGNRHLVLDMTSKEDNLAFKALTTYVFEENTSFGLKRRVYRDRVRYRFPLEYLDQLILTFPFIDLSRGLERKVMRGEEVRYAPEEIPEIEIPGFFPEKLPTKKLFDFQKVAIARLIDEQIPLTDGMGLGKTTMALAVLRARAAFYGKGTPCLIICPSNAKWVWERHLKLLTDLTFVIVDGTATQRRAQIQQDVHVVVINFEALRLHPELADYEWETIIVDEFHRLKNPDAQVTRCFMQIQANWVLPMSGTPILNCPEESWVILNRLWPKRYPSYFVFCRNLIIRSKGKKGWIVGYVPSQMRRLRTEFQKRCIRRRKDQVLQDLPKSMPPIDHEIDLLPEQRRLYQEILEESRLRLESGERIRITDLRVMNMRLRQACFSPELYGGSPRSAKVEEVKAYMEKIKANREKALIGAPWSTATRILLRELEEYNPAYVDGRVRGRKRVAQEEMFNHDPECHCYIGTITANRESISLGAATWILMPGEEWTPGYNDQFISRSAEGGIRGMGQKRVQLVRIYARNTIEKEVSETLRRKSRIFNTLVESDGGKPVPRRVVEDLAEIFRRAA